MPHYPEIPVYDASRAQPVNLFAPSVVFVDLETTGMSAADDAITEIGIVRVDADPTGIAPPTVTEWSTLVNPGTPIPPAIQSLTGITDAMVRDAPPFRAVAADVAARTADALFVAHNARFDYGFLKHAFAREGAAFTARVLCTVKLSRRLYPEAERHSLDSLIARHALGAEARHRALGDARVLWAFVQALYREWPADAIAEATKRVLKTPSLPPQLPQDAISSLPEGPGVYLFYGLNALPLYIGKSRNLRERVGAHFSSDYRSATDSRLSAEIRRIEYEETAGELGALLRESALVKALLPAHNHALRRKSEAGVLELAAHTRPSTLHPGRGRGRARAFRPLRPVQLEAPGARNPAPPRDRAGPLLEGARAGKASGRVLRATGEALRRRVRRRGIDGRASRAPRGRARAAGRPGVAVPRARRHPGAGAPGRAHRHPRHPRLVLARHRARRR